MVKTTNYGLHSFKYYGIKSRTRSQIYVKNKQTLLFLRPLWLSGRVPFVNVQHVTLSSSLTLLFVWGHTRVHNFGHFCLSVITHLVSLSLPSLPFISIKYDI